MAAPYSVGIPTRAPLMQAPRYVTDAIRTTKVEGYPHLQMMDGFLLARRRGQDNCAILPENERKLDLFGKIYQSNHETDVFVWALETVLSCQFFK